MRYFMNLFGVRSYGPLNNGSPKPGYDHVNNPWGEAETNQPQETHGLGRQIERITNVIGRLTAMVKQIVANEFTLRERCQFFFSLCVEAGGIRGRIASIFVKKLEGEEHKLFIEKRRSWETRTIPKNVNFDEASISEEEAAADLDSLSLFETK